MKVVLTPRCNELLQLLVGVRWITTRQVHRRFFPGATLNAVQKRLRKLVHAEFLRMFRRDRMSEAMFTLGLEGKRALERVGHAPVTLERRPPTEIDHFVSVNDVRIACELGLMLEFFFAYWELPGLADGWPHPIIPDAVFSTGAETYALEYDRGVESVGYFVRTKANVYERGLAGLPLDAVIIIADRQARMESLRRAIPNSSGLFLFGTIDTIRAAGIQGIFPAREVSGVLSDCPRERRAEFT